MPAPRKPRNQMTGNAGLFYVAWQLSRLGWHVILTVRNARGADIFAANDDESVVDAIQSKALSRRSDVPLGSKLQTLRSPWWIVTLGPNSDKPDCFVLALEEVKASAVQNTKEGKSTFWLPYRNFTRTEFREAWHRLGRPSKGESE